MPVKKKKTKLSKSFKKPSKKPKAKIKKVAKKKPLKPTKKTPKAPKKPVAVKKEEVIQGLFLGKVEDYYSHVKAIALTLQDNLAVGDTIRVKGHTTDLIQKIESIQINRADITQAKIGDPVGIKVNDRCRKGDRVYKI